MPADQEGRLRKTLLVIALGLSLSTAIAPATMPARWLRFEKDPYARLLTNEQRPTKSLGLFVWNELTYAKVAHVKFGSGAEKAGLRVGDEIVSVDGAPWSGSLPPSGGIRRIRYRRHHSLRETVAQPSEAPTQTVRAKAVEFSDGSLEGRIAIASFEEGTCAMVERAVKRLQALRASALELDLRHNPGGQLREASCVAGLFLGAGHPFTYLVPADTESKPELRLTQGTLATDLPLRVRVNEGTASSAEILAAALQDSRRAILVGQPTFGKGTVQAITELQKGLWLEHTTHRALRLNGRSIHLAGIQPQLTQ